MILFLIIGYTGYFYAELVIDIYHDNGEEQRLYLARNIK